MLAGDTEVIKAITNNDMAGLKRILERSMAGLDVITLCDIEGNVLARGHSDKAGDNVLSQKALSAALETGTGISTIEKGSVVGLSTRGSAAIRDETGMIIGAVTCGHDLSKTQYVDALKSINNCETTIFDGDTRMNTTLIDDKGDRVIGTQASAPVIEAVLKGKKDYPLQIQLFGKNYAAHYSPLIVDGEAIGMLFSGVRIDETMASHNDMLNTVLLVAVMLGILCALIALLLGIFAVSKPLKKISVFANRMKSGDIGLSETAPLTIDVHSGDEVGALARTMEDAYGELRGYVGEIKDRMQGLKAGDLVTESTYGFQGDFIQIKDSINDSIHNFHKIMSEVNDSAAQVSTGAKQIADGAQTLAQGSTEQASAIEQLSVSIGGIADQTGQNAGIAREAAELSGTIRDSAERGSVQMDQMMRAVKDINDASGQIGRVIRVIDDIAFQTNILALNAAVEAARAGQHGKGFAVVAEEVRNLAAKSAAAAKDTGALIENSIEKANLGLNIATQTSDSLKEIVDGINRSADIVSQIARSSEEQSASVTQINTGIDQVAQVVQQNSATAEESAAASEEMSSQASLLAQNIARFKLKNAARPSDSRGDRNQRRFSSVAEKANIAVEKSDDMYDRYMSV